MKGIPPSLSTRARNPTRPRYPRGNPIYPSVIQSLWKFYTRDVNSGAKKRYPPRIPGRHPPSAPRNSRGVPFFGPGIRVGYNNVPQTLNNTRVWGFPRGLRGQDRNLLYTKKIMIMYQILVK